MSQAARFRKIFPVLLLGALALYLVGNKSVALWDRDEPRYAQCSREMLQTGDWVVPRLLGKWRLEKPPLIYWSQAAAMSVLSDETFAVRLPSTLAMVLSALILGLTVRHFAGPGRALWAVFIFCTCGLAIGAAKMCITDAVLLLFVLSGQACLAWMYAANRRGTRAAFWIVAAFWISVGLAGLTKGPQAVGMHLFTMLILLALDARENFRSKLVWKNAISWGRQLRPLLGIPILACVVLPWIIIIHHRAPSFVTELFIKAGMHASESMDGHGEPPGYHLILIFGTFFPWSLLLPTTISVAWQNRRTPAIRFAMAAMIGPWLLMEMVKTKLPFYVLPAFPGLAFLTADALVRCARGQFDDLQKRIFMVAVGVWAIVALGLGAAPWFALLTPAHGTLPVAAMTIYSFCAVIYAIAVVWQFHRRRIARAAMAMGAGMVVMIAILVGVILPRFEFLYLSERLVADLNARGGCGANVRVEMIGYKEMSFAFYQGGGAREQENDRYLEITSPEKWPRWITIRQDIWDQMPEDRKTLLRQVAAERGIAYADNGRDATVLLLEKRQDMQVAGPGN